MDICIKMTSKLLTGMSTSWLFSALYAWFPPFSCRSAVAVT